MKRGLVAAGAAMLLVFLYYASHPTAGDRQDTYFHDYKSCLSQNIFSDSLARAPIINASDDDFTAHYNQVCASELRDFVSYSSLCKTLGSAECWNKSKDVPLTMAWMDGSRKEP